MCKQKKQSKSMNQMIKNWQMFAAYCNRNHFKYPIIRENKNKYLNQVLKILINLCLKKTNLCH